MTADFYNSSWYLFIYTLNIQAVKIKGLFSAAFLPHYADKGTILESCLPIIATESELSVMPEAKQLQI
jgi:hypothetical protein